MRKKEDDFTRRETGEIDFLVDDRPGVYPPEIDLSDEDIQRMKEQLKKLGIED